MSPAHIIPDPEAPAPRMLPDAWLTFSAALTQEVTDLAGRDDLTVFCAPGNGHGSPACFIPARAAIEIDGDHLGCDPATCDPRRPSDRERYPALWGALIHEAAHARHSRWTYQPTDAEGEEATTGTGTGAPGVSVTAHGAGDRDTTSHMSASTSSSAYLAATLLEESRIEAAQISRRPGDQRWLRACISDLVMAEYRTTPPASPDGDSPTSSGTGGTGGTGASPASPGGTPTPASPAASEPSKPAPSPTSPPTPSTAPPSGPAPAPPAAPPEEKTPAADKEPMTPWQAAYAAGLILARVDTGILDRDETAPLTTAVTTTLGTDTLDKLAAIWKAAHTTPDDDSKAMTDLGRRWCETIGVDPDQPPPPAPGTGDDASDGSGVPAAVSATLEAITATDAGDDAIPLPGDAKRDVERAHRKRAAATARRVFDPRGRAPKSGVGKTAIGGERPPTPTEQAAARKLARHLRAATYREPVTTTTTSAAPPGRLRMRAALAADAQRAAGAVPTAEPFTQTHRRPTPVPPLRVGIACDVSGSMYALADPIASAAWILARATGHLPEATSATVIFGDRVRVITRPGRAPASVTTFPALDGTEEFCDAVDALDAALGLSQPGAARLLVVVSDGVFVAPGEISGGTCRIARLKATGCGILWLAFGDTRPLPGSEVAVLSDPTDAATVIGKAAVRALTHL
ncbi:VWA containing CoxE family protein [Spongiactinospora rosea]|uniref:VWA containing CoxE family protein n=1 Tax=Spongiactinospora rosea TaxID=2248750 RepID=A0A366LUM0_9ACTN|nr:VWA domain-containing protein [Spongiactinospora rosea]RBQ17243.1 VWA containing CoxE family protein [Spongiactinospora rosea]